MAPMGSEFSQMDQSLGKIVGAFGSSPMRWRAVELEVPESARIVASYRASIAELSAKDPDPPGRNGGSQHSRDAVVLRPLSINLPGSRYEQA